MSVFYICAAGLLSALILGRDPRSLLKIQFCFPYLLLGGFGGEILLAALAHYGAMQNRFLLVAAFLAVAAGLFANRRLPGVWLILSGTAVNIAELLLNGGRMPVSLSALRIAGVPVRASLFVHNTRHVRMTPATWNWLGDWIPFIHQVLSPGDVCVAAGIVLFLVRMSVRRVRA